jgi:AAA family ATP:ADP antiporter
MQWFSQAVSNLWGLSSGSELKKFLYLAAGAFCLLGSFSPLKPLKESLFISMVGPEYYPHVKTLSVVLMFFVVLVYSKIVDYFSKQHLMYTFLSFFVVVGAGFVLALSHPNIGLANKVVSVDRWVAWGFYLFVETYLTVMISLFWSFVNDVTSAASAKKGYGMIMFGSQTGALCFAVVAKMMIADVTAYTIRVPILIALSLGLFSLLGFFVWRLTQLLPPVPAAHHDRASEGQSLGVLAGLKIVLTRPYVAGLFLLVLFQEMIMSLMHYQQAYLAKLTFTQDSLLTNYFFSMNLILQVLSCGFALLGTSYIHRTIGTRASLMSFPLLLIVSAIAYLVVPTLFVVTIFIVLLKGLHYAFNQPVRETLYIPTSKDIKYKAKAWIDVVGMRGAKAVGFQLAGFLGHASGIIGVVVLGLLSLWTGVASVIGKKNEDAAAKNTVIR